MSRLRTRVAYLTHCFRNGGAERWAIDWANSIDRRLFEIQGYITDPANIDAESVSQWERVAGPFQAINPGGPPVTIDADILVTWGSSISEVPAFSMLPLRRVFVVHGMGAWMDQFMAPASERCNRFVSVSEFAAQAFERIPGIPFWSIIPNGVDLSRCAPAIQNYRGTLGISSSKRVVGMIARMSSEKCPLLFPRLIASLPDDFIGLYVGSSGDYTERFLSEVNRFCQGRVHYIPSSDHIGNELSAMDVLFAPSDSEGFGLAVVEAMIARVPVVCTDQIGVVCDTKPNTIATTLPRFFGTEEAATAVEHAVKYRPYVDHAWRIAWERWNIAAFGERWTNYLIDLAKSKMTPAETEAETE